MNDQQIAEEYWQKEGIRMLAKGNQIPNPEERWKAGFLLGLTMGRLEIDLPLDAVIAAVEIPEEEVE